eukprot:5273576-Amphidinium_carterae.3
MPAEFGRWIHVAATQALDELCHLFCCCLFAIVLNEVLHGLPFSASCANFPPHVTSKKVPRACLQFSRSASW